MVKMMMTRLMMKKKKTVIVAWLFSPFEWLHSAWVCVLCLSEYTNVWKHPPFWICLGQFSAFGLFVCLQMEKGEEQNWTNEDNLKKFFSFVFVLLAGWPNHDRDCMWPRQSRTKFVELIFQNQLPCSPPVSLVLLKPRFKPDMTEPPISMMPLPAFTTASVPCFTCKKWIW